MIKSKTFCDFCETEFTSDYWDSQPAFAKLVLGGPAQTFESRNAEHLCKGCRAALSFAWDRVIEAKKKTKQLMRQQS